MTRAHLLFTSRRNLSADFSVGLLPFSKHRMLVLSESSSHPPGSCVVSSWTIVASLTPSSAAFGRAGGEGGEGGEGDFERASAGMAREALPELCFCSSAAERRADALCHRLRLEGYADAPLTCMLRALYATRESDAIRRLWELFGEEGCDDEGGGEGGGDEGVGGRRVALEGSRLATTLALWRGALPPQQWARLERQLAPLQARSVGYNEFSSLVRLVDLRTDARVEDVLADSSAEAGVESAEAVPLDAAIMCRVAPCLRKTCAEAYARLLAQCRRPQEAATLIAPFFFEFAPSPERRRTLSDRGASSSTSALLGGTRDASARAQSALWHEALANAWDLLDPLAHGALSLAECRSALGALFPDASLLEAEFGALASAGAGAHAKPALRADAFEALVERFFARERTHHDESASLRRSETPGAWGATADSWSLVQAVGFHAFALVPRAHHAFAGRVAANMRLYGYAAAQAEAVLRAIWHAPSARLPRTLHRGVSEEAAAAWLILAGTDWSRARPLAPNEHPFGGDCGEGGAANASEPTMATATPPALPPTTTQSALPPYALPPYALPHTLISGCRAPRNRSFGLDSTLSLAEYSLLLELFGDESFAATLCGAIKEDERVDLARFCNLLSILRRGDESIDPRLLGLWNRLRPEAVEAEATESGAKDASTQPARAGTQPARATTRLAGAAMAVGAAMRLLKGADSSSSAARGGIDASSMAALLLEPVDVSEVGTLLDAETKALVPLAHKLLLANKLTKLRLFTREPPQLNLLVRALYSYGLPLEERDACRAAAWRLLTGARPQLSAAGDALAFGIGEFRTPSGFDLPGIDGLKDAKSAPGHAARRAFAKARAVTALIRMRSELARRKQMAAQSDRVGAAVAADAATATGACAATPSLRGGFLAAIKAAAATDDAAAVAPPAPSCGLAALKAAARGATASAAAPPTAAAAPTAPSLRGGFLAAIKAAAATDAPAAAVPAAPSGGLAALKGAPPTAAAAPRVAAAAPPSITTLPPQRYRELVHKLGAPMPPCFGAFETLARRGGRDALPPSATSEADSLDTELLDALHTAMARAPLALVDEVSAELSAALAEAHTHQAPKASVGPDFLSLPPGQLRSLLNSLGAEPPVAFAALEDWQRTGTLRLTPAEKREHNRALRACWRRALAEATRASADAARAELALALEAIADAAREATRSDVPKELLRPEEFQFVATVFAEHLAPAERRVALLATAELQKPIEFADFRQLLRFVSPLHKRPDTKELGTIGAKEQAEVEALGVGSAEWHGPGWLRPLRAPLESIQAAAKRMQAERKQERKQRQLDAERAKQFSNLFVSRSRRRKMGADWVDTSGTERLLTTMRMHFA